ncbi:unnamed protein product [Peniophora sp. CBMAI 1063]|nr:unnamed protein product [Peniophora sp. CBMAI 1063]
MGLFKRNNASQDGSDSVGEKGNRKRPANTAFKQQRLKAWQPILTPKTVLPTLFIIGILFAPIGGLLVWGSGLITEITIDYTNCDSLNNNSDAASAANALTDVPSYSYRLNAGHSSATVTSPKYAFINNGTTSEGHAGQCLIQFNVPYDLDHSVLLYYRLTNFYQNHRRYVQSYDSDQLLGKARTVSDLDDSNCKPVAVSSNRKVIYPCGLIANSLFNDTFSSLTLLNPPAGTSSTYSLSEKGIAWPGESSKYKKPDYSVDDIVPPPNWHAKYGDAYTNDTLPDLSSDEHFQNWMRVAGLPTFSKLYSRNDNDKLVAGTYTILVDMNFPVKPYSGTKSIVISTVSWIGGKNPFLGWAYVAAASLFVALAIAGTIRHLLKPRRLGDMSLLSWNRT